MVNHSQSIVIYTLSILQDQQILKAPTRTRSLGNSRPKTPTQERISNRSYQVELLHISTTFVKHRIDFTVHQT
jgi:hypothetical protein